LRFSEIFELSLLFSALVIIAAVIRTNAEDTADVVARETTIVHGGVTMTGVLGGVTMTEVVGVRIGEEVDTVGGTIGATITTEMIGVMVEIECITPEFEITMANDLRSIGTPTIINDYDNGKSCVCEITEES
jgi:hypothetical protein